MRDPLCSGEDQWTMNWSSRKINLGNREGENARYYFECGQNLFASKSNNMVVDSYEWGNNSAEKREEIKLNTIIFWLLKQSFSRRCSDQYCFSSIH